MIKKFQTFYIEQAVFDHSTLSARFTYSFDHEEYFTETIDFAASGSTPIDSLDPLILENLLFHTSIALGISYYKLYPTESIIVTEGSLDEAQRSFWKKLYLQGLGEFLYRNEIVPEHICEFGSIGEKVYRKIPYTPGSKVLVPIGGGKDSLVSMGILEGEGRDYDIFTFGKRYVLHEAVAKRSGRKHLVIERRLDPHLFEMNDRGYYNGHVPITGIIAFVLQIVNYLYGYRADILSNEKSADIGNMYWHGLDINHQYSKSKEFEEDFRSYVEAYMSDTEYSSILRDMYEIEIAKRFSKMTEYFDVFSSCNNNFKVIESHKSTTNRWCLQCPKCAFVFAILFPFIATTDVETIFGRNLYEDDSLLPLYEELLGYSGHKPFECVGTNEEMILAVYLACEKYRSSGTSLPVILDFCSKNILSRLSKEDIDEMEKRLVG